MFNEEQLLIYIPSTERMIYIQEGSSQNLDSADLSQGYDSYIDYTESRLDDQVFEEYDGGEYLYNSNDYPDLESAIPDFIRFIIDKEQCPDYVVLSAETAKAQVFNQANIKEIDERVEELADADMER